MFGFRTSSAKTSRPLVEMDTFTTDPNGEGIFCPHLLLTEQLREQAAAKAHEVAVLRFELASTRGFDYKVAVADRLRVAEAAAGEARYTYNLARQALLEVRREQGFDI